MHPRDADAYSANRRTPRSIATVDGRRLAYILAGSGRPPVLFLAGAGMDIDGWFKVIPAVAATSTTLAWDRAGVGRSDRPTVAQTGAAVVADLRAVLNHSGLTAPFVVVGHSLGGLHAELFARQHPDELAGMVLVEAASPDEALDPPRPGRLARAAGSVSSTLDRVRGRLDGLGEVDHVATTVAQISAAPPFPPIPLVVVTGGARMRLVPTEAFEAHQAAQRSRVALSPHGRQVMAPGSGHFPQLNEPQVVIDAIASVTTSCRP